MKNTSRTPYIYKVTNLETHQYYIGSQCSGKTIGVNYFTSSTNKAFKDGFKTYGEEKYKIAIIKAFGDPKKCVKIENYIIRNHMLLKDGLCLNRFYCCNGEKIFSTVGTHPSPWNKGIPLSEKTKQKISLTKKGRPALNKGTHPSEETKGKMCIAHKGRPSPNKGIHWPEETRKKMSLAHKRIKISIEGMDFDSRKEASKYHNVSTTTISYWLKTKKHNAFYIKK